MLLVAIASYAIWAAQKKATLKHLQQQRYQDDVAAFKWHDDMDPIEFEGRCAEAMRFAGWAAQTTKGSGDQGVDVLATRDGIAVVLQCKKYNKSVGNRAVQEAFAAKAFANARYAAVVTNSQFTQSAHTLAASTGVKLLHFTDLAHPNKLFDLPDTPSRHNFSGVTDEEIQTLRHSRVKPAYVIGFCLAVGVG
ncbi:MAG: restriction endonuclease, partial [Acetobacteraceae bacterium]